MLQMKLKKKQMRRKLGFTARFYSREIVKRYWKSYVASSAQVEAC